MNFDEIRKEIAIEHGFLLDKSDPILVTVTLNSVLLERAVATLNAQNVEYQKRTIEAVIAVMQESLAKEKETAGKVITVGTDYVSERMNAVMSESENRMVKILSSHVRAMEEIRGNIMAAKGTALLAACIAGLYAVIAAWFALSGVA